MPRCDDPALTGDVLLYRRVPPDTDNVRWVDGNPVLSSYNFADIRHEPSFNIVSETSPEKMLEGHPGFGLITVSAGWIRTACINGKTNKCAIIICRDDEDPKDGHVLVVGKLNPNMRERIKKGCSWVEGYWPDRPVEAPDQLPPPSLPASVAKESIAVEATIAAESPPPTDEVHPPAAPATSTPNEEKRPQGCLLSWLGVTFKRRP